MIQGTEKAVSKGELSHIQEKIAKLCSELANISQRLKDKRQMCFGAWPEKCQENKLSAVPTPNGVISAINIGLSDADSITQQIREQVGALEDL